MAYESVPKIIPRAKMSIEVKAIFFSFQKLLTIVFKIISCKNCIKFCYDIFMSDRNKPAVQCCPGD